MGRARGWRRKRHYQLTSVRQKCFENQLRQEVRHRFGVCEAETWAVVGACVDYLRQAYPGDRGALDVAVEVPAGRALRWKVAPHQVPCIDTVLTPVAEDDADVGLEQGVRAMQTARLLRMVEQADRAEGTMPLSLLTSLVHQTTRTLTSRLRPLWRSGLYLPVLGIAESTTGAQTRRSWVLEAFVREHAVDAIRQALSLSHAAHGALLYRAARLIQGFAAGRSMQDQPGLLATSPMEEASVQAVIRDAERTRRGRQRLEELAGADATAPELTSAGVPIALRRQLEAHLIRRHAFSATRAGLLVEAVDEAYARHRAPDRQAGDIVFWAVAEGEPAGKALADCELVATLLPFYDPEADIVPRGTVGELKVRKAIRLAGHARKQGGLLSNADLAFLLGMGAGSLETAIKRTGLFVPTRGAIMDIGPGVTHRTEIIRLYVQGYTEPEIVRRTQHTYESVASYIGEFRRVMVLVDQGLPVTHIRKVLRRSLRLVEAYIALYRELDAVAEYQWKLNLMRRAALMEKKHQRTSR